MAVSGIVAVNSLPVISVSGNVIQISGQTVTVANAVSTGVSGQTIYLADNGVNNVVKISGQTVVASVVTNISGQVVATSGATVYLVADSVNNKVRVSGEAVRISGQLVNVAAVGGSVFEVTWDNDGANNVVWISGQTVIASVSLGTTPTSGDASRISGQTVYLVSGNNHVIVDNTVTTTIGNAVTVEFIDDGELNVVKISGQTVVAQVSLGTTPTSGDASRISGQTIYIIDDSINNKVKVSGQTVSVSGVVTVNSLPVISVSGNTIAVSGSVAVNSLPVISVSGNAVRTSGQTIYLVNDSINNVVKVSGQYVTVSGSVEITNPGDIICSISGNTVYLISGFNPVQVSGQSVRLPNDGVNNVVSISGQTVVASVSMGPTPTSGDAARVSGQTIYLVDNSVNNIVKISGQTLSVSGSIAINNASIAVTLPAVPTSGDASRISGQTIYLVDDSVNNKVKVSGQTVSVSGSISVNNSITVGALPVISISGNMVSISGQPVTANVTTNISGQVVAVSGSVVYFVDNGVNNVVKISGQTVVASVTMGPTPTSGDASRISGQTIYIIDDSINNKVKVSGQTVSVSGIVNIGNSLTIATLPTISVSGSHVSVSGSVMTLSGSITNISGNVVRVSGETVSVSGVVAITGGVSVNVSGGVSISGNKVVVSGEPVRLVTPTAIRTRAELACVALSGGTQLLSGDVRKATVLNAGSAGTVMYIGSVTDPPFSGFGFRLVAGNGLTIETNNFNNIRSFGATSGIMISYIGEAY